MRLNPALFNRFIASIGQRMLWRRSSMCPCIIEHSGASDPACPLCKGKGRVWAAPIEGVAGVTAQVVNPSFQDFGAMEQGDMTLTIPSNCPFYGIGKFDRITLLDSTDVFSRVLTRGVNDNLSDMHVESISRVFWRSADKLSIVEGGIPAVSDAGVLSWSEGEPGSGVQYSITGVRLDEYYAYNSLPSDRNEHSGAPLPKKMQLRKWDLFGR